MPQALTKTVGGAQVAMASQDIADFRAALGLNVVTGTLPAGTALVIPLVANGITGPFLLNVNPAAGCTYTIEISRDGASSWVQYQSAWSIPQSIVYSKAPADTSYATHVRLTQTVGTATTSVYEITGGVIAFNGAALDLFGVIQTKAIIVDGSLNYNVDPTNDRGIMLTQGIGVTTAQHLLIRTQAAAPWDYSRGAVFFDVQRQDSGAMDVTAVTPGTTVISNPNSIALVNKGPSVRYYSPAPNIWYVK